MTIRERFLKLKRWRTSLVGELSGDILEVGVGTGSTLAHYRSSGPMYAIEPGIERAQLAHQAGIYVGLNLCVQAAVAEHLPYAPNSFDHVVSSLVFCSVNDPRQALNEIHRVLKPGGTLHMVEHVRPQNQMLAILASTITPGWRRVAKNCHLNRPTVDHLCENGWDVRVHGRFGVFVHLSATQVQVF